MSEPAPSAIQLRGVGKVYKLFAKPRDHVLDALGLGVLLKWRGVSPQLFWALRNVDLDVAHGQRVGIIGRNGAGKSTLLKIITGLLSPTEGTVDVDGRVQALFEAGSGFHPEFTGYENIHASLTYQGLNEAAIRAATDEIAEFSELGDFLKQPLKSYSAGMQARLAFAVATATRPRILIVDEVLGAGDAYFASKSSERMRTLVEDSGTTVLLVSHDASAILRYCEECVWVERGRIVQRGRAMDVVNAYEAFIHEMQDRRLRAKNRRRAQRTASGAVAEGANGEAEPEALAPGKGGVLRWPSEGSLTFERVALLDLSGQERALFETGSPLCLRLELKAHRSGTFNVVLGASFYRLDGVFISNVISPCLPLELNEGEHVEVGLEIPRLPLGDARYVVSLSAFEREVAEQTRYDLLARTLEFEVVGNPPLTMQAVVQLEAQWRVGADAKIPDGSS